MLPGVFGKGDWSKKGDSVIVYAGISALAVEFVTFVYLPEDSVDGIGSF